MEAFLGSSWWVSSDRCFKTTGWTRLVNKVKDVRFLPSHYWLFSNVINGFFCRVELRNARENFSWWVFLASTANVGSNPPTVILWYYSAIWIPSCSFLLSFMICNQLSCPNDWNHTYGDKNASMKNVRNHYLNKELETQVWVIIKIF